jgi:ribosome biogenesis GTPase / thiamine phosphate phosphatase
VEPSEILKRLGWNPFFEQQLTKEEILQSSLARVVEPSRGLVKVLGTFGKSWAESTLGHKVPGPAVGDWVIGKVRDLGAGEKRFSIDRILSRKNKLSREATGGKGYEQILCANVDQVFLVLAANLEPNLQGIQRTVAAVLQSKMAPLFLITKTDVAFNLERLSDTLRELGPEIPQISVSVKEGKGVKELLAHLNPGTTSVLLGASGVGKSSLTNFLLECEVQKVAEVRQSDQKGRHTTTGRQLSLLPSGAMLIDSPGIREFQSWEDAPARKTTKAKGRPKADPQTRGRYRSEEE